MSTVTAYEVHPLAHLLPEMRDAEYAELRDDIAANGLHEAITLHEEQILDGRHRYRACEELGVGAHYVLYEGDAPAAYVLSLNVKRRQLTQSQKAMLATDFLPHLAAEAHQRQVEAGRHFGRGAESSLSEDTKLSVGPSARHAAEQVGVGEAQVNRANRVKKDDPELAERIRAGEITVGAAHSQVTARQAADRARVDARTAALRGEPRRNAPAHIDTPRGQQQAKAAARRFTDLASTLAGYAEGVESLDIALIRAAMEPAELDQWISSLGKSLTKLRRFRTDLQEGRN